MVMAVGTGDGNGYGGQWHQYKHNQAIHMRYSKAILHLIRVDWLDWLSDRPTDWIDGLVTVLFFVFIVDEFHAKEKIRKKKRKKALGEEKSRIHPSSKKKKKKSIQIRSIEFSFSKVFSEIKNKPNIL